MVERPGRDGGHHHAPGRFRVRAAHRARERGGGTAALQAPARQPGDDRRLRAVHAGAAPRIRRPVAGLAGRGAARAAAGLAGAGRGRWRRHALAALAAGRHHLLRGPDPLHRVRARAAAAHERLRPRRAAVPCVDPRRGEPAGRGPAPAAHHRPAGRGGAAPARTPGSLPRRRGHGVFAFRGQRHFGGAGLPPAAVARTHPAGARPARLPAVARAGRQRRTPHGAARDRGPGAAQPAGADRFQLLAARGQGGRAQRGRPASTTSRAPAPNTARWWPRRRAADSSWRSPRS